jgi:hypothetical protein
MDAGIIHLVVTMLWAGTLMNISSCQKKTCSVLPVAVINSTKVSPFVFLL